MEQNEALYQEFLQSRQGKVYKKQGFRNFVGRCLHGITRHPIKTATIGLALLPLAGINPVAGLASFGGLFSGFLGSAAKAEEKIAREFLMNVAIRKSNAFKSFLDKKGIDEALKAQSIEHCLKKNSPLFGGFEEFRKDMPDAVSRIMNSQKDDELPYYRTQGVLRNEAMQKLFKQRGSDGGIWQGLKNILTGEERAVRKLAEQQLSGQKDSPRSIADVASNVSMKQLMQELSQTPLQMPQKDTNKPSLAQQYTSQTNLQASINKKLIDAGRG